MPIAERPLHQNIHPADVTKLVVKSLTEGWAEIAPISFEEPK
jgi:hypothetical protein